MRPVRLLHNLTLSTVWLFFLNPQRWQSIFFQLLLWYSLPVFSRGRADAEHSACPQRSFLGTLAPPSSWPLWLLQKGCGSIWVLAPFTWEGWMVWWAVFLMSDWKLPSQKLFTQTGEEVCRAASSAAEIEPGGLRSPAVLALRALLQAMEWGPQCVACRGWAQEARPTPSPPRPTRHREELPSTFHAPAIIVNEEEKGRNFYVRNLKEKASVFERKDGGEVKNYLYSPLILWIYFKIFFITVLGNKHWHDRLQGLGVP